MRLKKLEIKGFKSFAHETILNFNEDVIGIVGPNGSGKSNVVDAIRWVLGEQKSRELRLEKMNDIIFSGSRKKKKSGKAQVTLSFDNTKNILPTEFETVSISRHLLQTGESEYRLNNVPCRLKDILSLFIDTGIGSNSYAIISLGMVDDILINKDYSRRKMFEQASGISKYKTRKKETLNKLKNTEADLERIDDLLFEIEQNLKDLEKQARRAKRYFGIKENYKVLSIQLANQSIALYLSQRARIENQLQAEETKSGEIAAKIHVKESDLQKLKALNLKKEEHLSKFQKEQNALIQHIRKSEYDRELVKERMQFNEKQLRDYQTEQSKNESKILEYKKEIQEIDERQILLSKTRDTIQSDFDSLNKEFLSIEKHFEEAKSSSDKRSEYKIQTEKRINELEMKLAVTESNLDAKMLTVEELKESMASKSRILSAKRNEMIGVQSEIQDSKNQIESLEEKLALNEKKKTKITQSVELGREKLQLVNRKTDSLENESKLILQMIEKLEGFPESIKFLNANFQHSLPLLADVIHVDEKYRIALENYLGDYLNYFIADNVEEAIAGIDLLQTSQKGRANFFILSAHQRPVRASETDLGISLHTLVKCDQKYRYLVEKILEGVRVVDMPLDELKTIASPENVTFIGASGNFIKGPGTLSGGSIEIFQGTKIGRKKQLQSLHKRLDSLKSEKNELVEQLKQQQTELQFLTKDKTALELAEIKAVNLEAQKSQITLQAEIQSLQEQVSANGERKSALEKIIEEDRLNMDQFLSDLEIVRHEIDQKNKMEGDIDREFKTIAGTYSESSNKLNSKRIQLIQADNELNSARRDLEYRKGRVEELLVINSKNLESEKILNEEQDEFKKQLKKIDEELIVEYEKQNLQTGHLGEAERDFFKMRGQIVSLENEIREISKRAGLQQNLINQLKEKHQDLRFEIDRIKERLNIQFQLGEFNPQGVVRIEDAELEDLKVQVEKLKSRLENYGEINPLALEAYEEILARFEDIQTQRQDILDARDSLHETIGEIEMKAGEKFMESFEKVRMNFKLVFRSLFTDDDDCDLYLTGSESPLEANIEIVAKPKGKKPRTLSQLSGGEKTLTAIALLFSLYLLKPAPFCIFDEVDAPLDDANILKFNKIIKKFSKKSQFIIITHNKLTMAEVSILYGIYMQEEGVSQVSPVDLRNYEYEVIENVG